MEERPRGDGANDVSTPLPHPPQGRHRPRFRHRRNDPFDVGITDGRIAEINLDLKPEDAQEVIGVAGKLVIPGMIDTHAHSD